MVGEAFAGLSAIKTAFDMAQGLQKIHDVAGRDRAVIELQKEILAAQSAQATLLSRIGELEKEVARFETWEAEKQRYQLQKLPPGVFVYALKPAMAAGEPAHQICEKCYQNDKKSLLHGFGKEGGIEKFTCHGCGTDFYIGVGRGSVESEYDPFWNEDGSPRR